MNIVIIIGLTLFLRAGGVEAALSPGGLRCEYGVDPAGVDVAQPRLFWVDVSEDRGQRQTAYEIIAASSPGLLTSGRADLWRSGKVLSDETTQIHYGGRELKSSEQVFWRVQVWDRNGSASFWSDPATWTMGVLDKADWQANWIGAAAANLPTLLLRREFTVKPRLARAVVNVCGLGQYEMSLNGKTVGEDVLSPGWTDYRKTCLYDTRDITPLLRTGKNAVGLMLAGGMYNIPGGNRYAKFRSSFGPLKAMAQIRLEYADGSVETIGTDGSWRASAGPITFSSVFGGENFDGRLVQAGWDTAGFNEATWEPARVVEGPGGELKGFASAAPPIRGFGALKPVAQKAVRTNVTVYDFGQNASMMARWTVSGPAGAVVRVVPAEMVDTNGFADRSSAGGRNNQVYWQYTLAGKGVEKYASKFFYQGCRYLQVEMQPATPGGALPVLKDLQGVVVHSASTPVGEFECSNPLFNRIRALVRWAQCNNMMSLMTDCPHREKLGWLEEDHLNGPALRYEFDLAQLFGKQMNDMADAQTADGLVPDIAPEYAVFQGGFRDSPEWGSACVLVPWQQYEFDGDVDLLRKRYETMKNYVAYLGRRSVDHIANFGLGDWYDIGPKPPGTAQLTPVALTATAFYYYDTWILSQTAELLGRAEEATLFANEAGEIRAAFNAKFFDATNQVYATGSQTANAIPLVMNLAEPAERAGVLEAIVRDVRAHGNAITAGDVGYRYLLRALAAGGRSEVIFDMNNQSDKPGYGYQLKMGATSLTEAWDARRGSSQDHFMLGQIQEWFYHDLAGIRCDPAGPGFKKIIIAPQMVGEVTWTKAHYDSIHGRIECEWEKAGGRVALAALIPANTSATIFVPAKSAGEVSEGGVNASRRSGVKFLRYENGCAVYEVGAGKYVFRAGD